MLNAIAMTVDKKEIITIPKYLVIIVVPIIVSVLSSLITDATTKATLETKITKQDQEIQQLFETKTDRTEQTLIMKSLDRIEAKLDGHIDKK
jgi:uncharacterized membrane protein (DUF106 family)